MVLHIEVDEPDVVEQHMKRAHQKAASRFNIPGFRKGKAPRTVVERFVGREYLLEEALETLVPDVVNDVIKDEGIEASARPSVEIVEREPVVKLDATVPLPSEATLGDYKDIRFDDKAEEVTDEQVEESIQNLLNAQATWEDTDQASTDGDLVTITVRATVEGEDFVNQTDAEYLAASDNPNPVPGFSAEVIGMAPGGSKQFSLQIPEDFSRPELAGKSAEFEVSASAVKRKVLPELNDDLVKGLGEGLNTVADLRSRIRENLEARADQALRESLEEKVIDELVERTTFEVAPLLIEHEAEHILHDQQHALARYNISFEQYMRQTGRTGDELVAKAKQSAETRLKRTLVMDKLADAESIEPSDEEVSQEIELWKAQSQGNDSQVDYDSDDTRKSVVTVLRRRKAMERAIEIARSTSNGAAKSSKGGAKTGSRRKKQTAAVAEAGTDSEETTEEKGEE